MAVSRKSLRFLPGVFQTPANQKFLDVTLDQLVSEPRQKRINGFIGRPFAPTYQRVDNYIQELTPERQYYQLEPSLVMRDSNKEIEHVASYSDLVNKLEYYGALTNDNDRLFSQDQYNFNPRVDLDKLTNFSNYYWAPKGLLPITVTQSNIGMPNTFTLLREEDVLRVAGIEGTYPELSLIRGETYTIQVQSGLGNIVIQSEPGRDGYKKYAPAVSTRSVFGVGYTGTAITFSVPAKSAQDGFVNMPIIDDVDLALTETFTQLDNAVWQFGIGMNSRLDGRQFYPDGTRVIFINNSSLSFDWIDRNGQTVPLEHRTNVWEIKIIPYPGQPARMHLKSVRLVPPSNRIVIKDGDRAGNEYYRAGNIFQQVPNLTSQLDTLYYVNDYTGHYGKIKLYNKRQTAVNVGDIIGSETYTLANGIKLSNGMRINFGNDVVPTHYKNKTFAIEGVGKNIKLIEVEKLRCVEIDSENYVAFDTTSYGLSLFDEVNLRGTLDPDYIVINRSSIDGNPWARNNCWYHRDILEQSLRLNFLPITFEGYQQAKRPIIEFESDLQLFNYGRVFLGFVSQFFDDATRLRDGINKIPITDARLQVNTKKFKDLANQGLRLIEGQSVIFSNDSDPAVVRTVYTVQSASLAPSGNFDGIISGTIILEFGDSLIKGISTNFFTQVAVGDLLLSPTFIVIGKIKQIITNESLVIDSKANFTARYTGSMFLEARVELVVQSTAQDYDSIAVEFGNNAKKNFYYLNNKWNQSQQKTKINEPPLFDIILSNDLSLSRAFTDSSFSGTKLFSYKLSETNFYDKILNLPLTYLGVGSILGDLVFENNLETDTFLYRENFEFENRISENIYIGFLRKIVSRNNFSLVNQYDRIRIPTRQYQHVTEVFTGETNYFEIGAVPSTVTDQMPSLKVYVNNVILKLRLGDEFAFETVNSRHAVKIRPDLLTVGDTVDILFFSRTNSEISNYQLPDSINYNPGNHSNQQVTFGQLRSHVALIGENDSGLVGDAIGISNLRDRNPENYIGSIRQYNTSVGFSFAFITNTKLSFLDSCEYAKKEYVRFKNKFLEKAGNYLASNQPVADIVDEIMTELTFNRSAVSMFPFFNSDMVPFSFAKTKVSYHTVTNPSHRSYNLADAKPMGPSNQAVLVYLNGQLLKNRVEYRLSVGSIELTETVNLVRADIITIKEYSDTNGGYVPETPSKLGLFPLYVPGKIRNTGRADLSYQIQGHDGSLTLCFNDRRDDILLELETRIYNNVKVDYSKLPFDQHFVIPGKFRKTLYNLTEFNNVRNIEFLKWIGQNNLDLSDKDFFQNNDEFTWNYETSTDFDGQTVPGFYREIYSYFFDTDRPDSHPWEMLGYSIKPHWWDEYYSWTDTEKRARLIQAVVNGRTLEPYSPNYLTFKNALYARSDFEQCIPVNEFGRLLSPQQTVVKFLNNNELDKSFTPGLGSPAQTVYQKSSEYAFDLQKIFALLRPVDFFGTFINTHDLYTRQVNNGQVHVLTGKNRRINLNNIEINGELVNNEKTYSSGYLNWIVDFLINLGYDGPQVLRESLNQLQFNLTYRVGGFTDKQYLSVIVEQFNLASNSQSIILPDESYDIHLNKSVPVQVLTYSAVTIEPTRTGFRVSGFDKNYPYFIIIPSQSAGTFSSQTVADEEIYIFDEYRLEKLRVPYGFEFANRQQVVDFLISYQRYLLAQGFTFDTYDESLKAIRDWTLSAKEFITWSKQGWTTGDVLVLSPILDNLNVYNENTFVDYIDNSYGGSQIVGANFKSIATTDLIISRTDKLTSITTVNGSTICFARLHLVEFENVMVFNNRTVFDDLIFDPITGARQFRLKITGTKTQLWDGDLTPPGFVYMMNKVDKWISNKDYKKGELVAYKAKNYTAIKNIIGSDYFNASDWKLVNNVFKSGLAPNFSHNAAKFKDIYDIDSYTLDEQLTELSHALIGYRPRPYFDNLGLSKNTQIKFYQGYLKTKGTQNAMLSIAQGHFDGVKDTIEIFEEWAARTGEYGSIDNNPSYTFAIKTNKTIKNPLLYWFTENLYTTLAPSFDKLSIKNLESAPDDYDSHVFLNRPEYDKNRIWRIELYGDSIVCGKKLETDDYSIQILKRRKYSTLIQNKNNYSLAVIEKGVDVLTNCMFNETMFDIRVSSQEQVEKLFVTIETPTLLDRQLQATKYRPVEVINQIFSNQDFFVNFTSIESDENLFITLETPTANDSPLSTTIRGDLYRPSYVFGGDEIIVATYSIDNSERLQYEFSDVDDNEKPLSRTSKIKPIRSDVRVCLNDKVTGRVENPPDFLLYEYLQNKFKVAITTRSVEGSSSGDFLNGRDGVNGPWPDNVDADIVLINHGLNDALNSVDIEEYKHNLRRLRTGLKSGAVFVWQLPGKIVSATVYDEINKIVTISNNDFFIVYESNLTIQGTSGQEEIFIKPDVYNIMSGTLINKINLPYTLDQYEYRQNANKVELYYEDQLQISCEIPIVRDGIMFLTRQGSARVLLRDGIIYIGSQAISDRKELLFFVTGDIDTNLRPTRRLGANNIKPYAMAMLEVATEFGDYYADVYNYTDYLKYISEDGIHPTQEGYLKINDDVIAPVIERALTDISNKFKKRYEDDLPNAGYVIDAEVDAKVFDINGLFKDSSAILPNLRTGFRFWVAYGFDREWQVYRAYQTDTIIITARTDLDNKLVLGLNKVHDYQIGDLIAVRGISAIFDGIFQIFNITEFELIVISANDLGTVNADLDELNGQLFEFQFLRFNSHRELLSYTPKRPWIGQIKYNLAVPGTYYDIVYVDNDIDYRWAVMAIDTNSLSYDNLLSQTSFLTNIYSIVGIDCSRVNSLIFTANRGDSLQFCITSVESSETLYYTIETPTQEEESLEFVYEYGERVETVRVSQEVPINVYSFRTIRKADDIVDIQSVNNIYVYSNKDKRVLETLDLYDPVKGRILSTVRQDLDYILEVDPANYSKIQTTTTNLMFPKEIFWSSDQVGIYWWNTRNCKFHYYEQGSLEDRVQNWGTLFPGSVIEVYEWISSDVLPSQHVKLGRDGIPLYANDEYYSEDLYVDPITDILSYRYFFWVKSSVEKRNTNKTHSTVNCETIIIDPIRQNIPYLAALRDDSIAVYNVSEYLTRDEIVLYLSTKRKLNEQIIHTEFKLLQEFDRDSLFPERIESKLIDSVIGADKDGNLVPDPRLTRSGKIGLGVVPQQTLIENFLDARRNLVDYINNILIKYPIRSRLIDEKDVISDNFFAYEPIPAKSVGQIDTEAYFIVTDNSSAEKVIIKLVDPEKIRLARNQLNNVQSLYHVSGIAIKGTTLYNSNYSFYFEPDTIEFFRDNDALGQDNWDFTLIEAYANSLPPSQSGKAVKNEKLYVFTSYLLEEVTTLVLGYDFYEVAVESREQLFTQFPLRETINILVTSDSAQDGKWSIYRRTLLSDPAVELRYDLKLVRKQAFDATQYWNYVDWFADGYSNETLINHIVSNYYELYTKTLSVDDIIYIGKQLKYQNRSEIAFAYLSRLNNFELYRVSAVKDGDFFLELIGSGNGTIQLSPKLYQAIGYDGNEYDVNSHDVTTFQEMRYIIQGLKDDVFIGDLKSEYNRMLFMIVEYILSKQKYIDWFFKTSFITVKKSTPSFEQRSHIIRDKEGSIREYIEEVKPYKTKIRQFIPRHTGIENFYSTVTDFDLPPYYDKTLMRFRSPSGEEPEIDGPLYTKPQYRDWYENYKYRLDALLISSGGFGFSDSPEVEFYRRDTNTKTKPNVTVGVDTLSSSIIKIDVEKNEIDFTLTPKTYLLGDGGSQNFQYKKYEFTVVSIGYSAIYSSISLTRYLQFKRGFGLYGSDSQLNIIKYYNDSLLKADNWKLGSGDANGFSQNGLVAENERILDKDPWNQKSLVWEVRPSGDGNADGGWNGSYFPIDRTKLYRSSVWIRRTSLSSDGLFYHGLHTNGTHPSYNPDNVPNGNVIRLSDGLGEWNPYWDYAYTNSYAKDEWYLLVGHVFPTQYAADVVHPDSGIYNRTGKKVRPNGGNIANDCKFPANATQAMQRVYLYYCSDNTVRGQFAYPRWDLIDGTEPSIQDLLDVGPYMDVKYNEPKRGYTLHRIRRADGQLAFTKTYDLWAYPPGLDLKQHPSADLARDLNATTSEFVVVVYVYDEGKLNRLANNLPEAMYRCGASRAVFGNTDTFKLRSAYILVGIPGCGEGRGIENYAGEIDNSPNAYAQVKFCIEQGYLTQIGADPLRYLLATSLILPANAVRDETKTHGDITYRFDGKTWLNTKKITNFLPINKKLLPAKLVPILSNRLTRKVKTILKFDRTGYTTQVQNWEPYREYKQNQIISYNNRGYIVNSDIGANLILDTSKVTEVGTVAGIGADRYRNAYFDNANDRIMAYYVPSEFNGNVPKDLARLVPGVSSLHSKVLANVQYPADTILIGDAIGSAQGIASGNIRVDGGRFIEALFAHSPEELLPGRVMDSLSIRVLTQSTTPGVFVPTVTTCPEIFSVEPEFSYVDVPYGYGSIQSGGTFNVIMDCCSDSNTYPVIIRNLNTDLTFAAFTDIGSFTLRCDEQRVVQFKATGVIDKTPDWYDLSDAKNHHKFGNLAQFTRLVDDKPFFRFNGVNHDAFGPLVGANTNPGGANTVQIWIRWRGDNQGRLVSFSNGYSLWLSSNSPTFLGFSSGGNDLYGTRLTQYLHKWVMVTAVFYNGPINTNKLYYNLMPINLKQRYGSSSTQVATTSLKICPYSDSLGIDIGEIMVYNRELRYTEIEENYHRTKSRYPIYPGFVYLYTEPAATFSFIEKNLPAPSNLLFYNRSTRTIEYTLDGIGDKASYDIKISRLYNLYAELVNDLNSYTSWDMPGLPAGSTSVIQTEKFNNLNSVWKVTIPNIPLPNPGYSSWRLCLPSNYDATYGTRRRLSFKVRMINGSISSLALHNGGGNAVHTPSMFTLIPSNEITGVSQKSNWYNFTTEVSGEYSSGQCVGVAILNENIEFLITEPQVVNSNVAVSFLNSPPSSVVSLVSPIYGKVTELDYSTYISNTANLAIDVVHGTTVSQDSLFKYALEFVTEDDTYIHYHDTHRRNPVAFTGLRTFIDWADTESYPGRGTVYNFIDLTGGPPPTSTTTSTSTSTSTTSTSTSTSTTSTSTTSTTTQEPQYGWALYPVGGAVRPGTGSQFQFAYTAPNSFLGATLNWYVVDPNTTTPFSQSSIYPSALQGTFTLTAVDGSGAGFTIPYAPITVGTSHKFQVIVSATDINSELVRSTTCTISGPWTTGYAVLPLTKTITDINYFSTSTVKVINGDGSNDSIDWAVFNFSETGHGDFDGFADTKSHFGGESTASGGAGGVGATYGGVWGYDTAWKLLYVCPLGSSSGSAHNHTNGGWFTAGGTVTSGSGKRSEYEIASISQIGFSAHVAPISYNNATATAGAHTNMTGISAAGAKAFAYTAMPGGPRTMLDFITSFGVVGTDPNTG